MIPLCLITGFLGAGKTTFLRRIVDQNRQRKLGYLVNEFSPVDVDGRLLDCPPGDLVSISGGSIFCRCLVTQFIGQLKKFSDEVNTSDAPLEGVVIEASGIADPKVVTQMLAETGLDQVYQLSNIINIVDPGSFLKLIHTLPNIVSQIEACNLAVINKTDLYGNEQILQTEKKIREYNPSVETLKTAHCRIDVDLFAAAPQRSRAGQYATCADPNFVILDARVDGPVDAPRLTREITALQDKFYRVKGFITTERTTLYLDVSPSGTQLYEHPATQDEYRLVVIAAAENKETAQQFVKRLESGEFCLEEKKR
jgi:G3E family GTPase